MIYTVVGVSGSYGELISDTIRQFGCISNYSSFGASQGHAIIITYPWEYYDRVMTLHFVKKIKEEYNNGNKEVFTNFIKFFYNPYDFNSPNEITYDDWAEHVIDAYKHIGTHDVLNGVRSSLVKRIDISLPITEIKLHDIITDRRKVLLELAKLLKKPLTVEINDFFNTGLNELHLQIDPYLHVINKRKLTYKVNPEETLQYHYLNNLGYPGIHPQE